MEKYFANTLKEIRKIKGITQAEMAEDLGVSAGYIGVLEQGRSLPSYPFMLKVVVKYKPDANMFFGIGKDES